MFNSSSWLICHWPNLPGINKVTETDSSDNTMFSVDESSNYKGLKIKTDFITFITITVTKVSEVPKQKVRFETNTRSLSLYFFFLVLTDLSRRYFFPTRFDIIQFFQPPGKLLRVRDREWKTISFPYYYYYLLQTKFIGSCKCNHETTDYGYDVFSSRK